MQNLSTYEPKHLHRLERARIDGNRGSGGLAADPAVDANVVAATGDDYGLSSKTQQTTPTSRSAPG